jgi:hypothetical protein
MISCQSIGKHFKLFTSSLSLFCAESVDYLCSTSLFCDIRFIHQILVKDTSYILQKDCYNRWN